ncbi:MAG: hypothetical protein ACRERU_07710 [Methylococcales bacterium]
MLRISPNQSSASLITFVLEGRLLGPWVAELQSAVAATGFPVERVSLNLSGVQFADASGVELLQHLARQGIHLEALSPFIQELFHTRIHRDSDFASPEIGAERSPVDQGEKP